MLQLSAADLLLAFTDQNADHEWFLDRVSGECVLIGSDVDVDEESDIDVFALMKETPERFLTIKPISSKEAFRIRQSFVQSLDDEEMKQVLTQALAQKRAFQLFADRLHDSPAVMQQWQSYDRQILLHLITAQLASQSLEFEWIT